MTLEGPLGGIIVRLSTCTKQSYLSTGIIVHVKTHQTSSKEILFFPIMRFIVTFVTAVFVPFLFKLRRPKKKRNYDRIFDFPARPYNKPVFEDPIFPSLTLCMKRAARKHQTTKIAHRYKIRSLKFQSSPALGLIPGKGSGTKCAAKSVLKQTIHLIPRCPPF